MGRRGRERKAEGESVVRHKPVNTCGRISKIYFDILSMKTCVFFNGQQTDRIYVHI